MNNPGPSERSTHPEGELFDKFFTRLLVERTGSCWERDVLRACKEHLWAWWKLRASTETFEDFDKLVERSNGQ